MPAAAVDFLLDKIDGYQPRQGEDALAYDGDGPPLDYEEFLERFLEQ